MTENSTNENGTSSNNKPIIPHPHDLQRAIKVRINFIASLICKCLFAYTSTRVRASRFTY